MKLSKRTVRFIAIARSVLNLASSVWPKMPNKDDTPVGKMVKIVSVLDSIYSTFVGKSSELLDLVARLDMQERRNRFFGDVFFGAGLDKVLKGYKSVLSEHMNIHVFENGSGGKILFSEYSSKYSDGTAERNDTFFHTADFEFSLITPYIWDKYPDGIYLTLESGRSGRLKLCAIPPSTSEVMSQEAKDRLSELMVEHRKFLEEGISRSYLFAGPPGTGKSSMVTRMARGMEGRLLKLDSDTLRNVGVTSIGLLLDVFQPTTLIVDDIDRMAVYHDTASLLFLLEYLKGMHCETTVFMTANHVAVLPDALRRRGRVDKHLLFNLPDPAERLELTKQLLAHHNVKLSDSDLEKFLLALDGLSQADISVLCEDLKIQTLDSVLRDIEAVKSLERKIKKAVEEGDTPDV